MRHSTRTAPKMREKTNFYPEQFSGRTGCFGDLTVLFDKLNELGEVAFH